MSKEMRCNFCGREKRIALVTLLDGSICEQCALKNFYRTYDGRIVPRHYNGEQLMTLINSMNNLSKQSLLKTLREIQARYITRVMGYDVDGRYLVIAFETRHRRKKAAIYVAVDTVTNTTQYEVVVKNNLNFVGGEGALVH